MLPLVEKELIDNRKIGELATILIDKLENETPFTKEDKSLYQKINLHCEELNNRVEETALTFLNQNKLLY